MNTEESNVRSRPSLTAVGIMLGCAAFVWLPVAQAQLAPAPSDPQCTETVTVGPADDTVTIVVNITDDQTKADGTTFDSPVPSPVTVTGVTCAVVSGATCGTMTFTANDASGTLTGLNHAGSANITITGSIPHGSTGAYSNTTTLAVANGVTVPTPWNNTCTNSTSLPVKLQEFDVK